MIPQGSSLDEEAETTPKKTHKIEIYTNTTICTVPGPFIGLHRFWSPHRAINLMPSMCFQNDNNPLPLTQQQLSLRSDLRTWRLFLILAAGWLRNGGSVLQLLLQELVHRECDGLSGCHTHDSGCNTLVEGMEALLLEHIPCDICDSAPGRVSGVSRGLLETGLDGIDRCVGERAHGTGNQSDEGCLVGGKLCISVLGLPALEDGFEFGIGGEVDSLVGTWVLKLASVMQYAGNRSTRNVIT